MSITGKIRTLFTDKTQTEALFPRTKISAVSDDNNVGLNVILSNIISLILPSYSSSDEGKFLRVVNGSAAWDTVPNAEEASF